MQIIVTGGAGFIGSRLVSALEAFDSGHRVVVVDDFSSGDFRNLRHFKGDIISRPCEELDWDQHFGRQEIVSIYHLASITDTTVSNQREMVERNVESFRRILRFSQSRGFPVVYASSAATYGQADGLMKVEQQAAPANVYGFSKMILDNLGEEARELGMRVSGVRYFNVYGPHEAHKGKMASMVFQLYRQMKAGQRPRVFETGQHLRDFVYVDDVVAGTMLAATSEAGIYNIGSGKARSFNDIIAILNECLGTDLEPEYIPNPYIAFYQNHTEADISRSKKKLGYEPQYGLKKGIRAYVDWLSSNDAA
ncbi:MAG: ADP-glyceromanno-heptose 6-epimerase [Planctomycetales bacterium]|nr:ADP-glyceromanno-heptose 6-epimerase [bacterium]UNM07731.1 MAG: ADP-glyceromanno-heptose 6-epimerase [Planctomycetales bacterium]